MTSMYFRFGASTMHQSQINAIQHKPVPYVGLQHSLCFLPATTLFDGNRKFVTVTGQPDRGNMPAYGGADVLRCMRTRHTQTTRVHAADSHRCHTRFQILPLIPLRTLVAHYHSNSWEIDSQSAHNHAQTHNNPPTPHWQGEQDEDDEG